MDNTLMTELFAPYVEAVNDYNICCDAYRDAQRAASDILRNVEKRQRAEQAKIVSKITDLENEEKRLKMDIRQRVLKGEASPDADLGTGARLAVIYEQKAALQALADKRRMTDEEKSQWEKAVDDLDEATNSLNKSINLRGGLTARLRAYVNSLEYWSVGTPNRNNEPLFDKAYSLNSDGGADDEEI